jgi:hypothetical protein
MAASAEGHLECNAVLTGRTVTDGEQRISPDCPAEHGSQSLRNVHHHTPIDGSHIPGYSGLFPFPISLNWLLFILLNDNLSYRRLTLEWSAKVKPLDSRTVAFILKTTHSMYTCNKAEGRATVSLYTHAAAPENATAVIW